MELVMEFHAGVERDGNRRFHLEPLVDPVKNLKIGILPDCDLYRNPPLFGCVISETIRK
jgi:hypothetical protein